MATLYYVTTPAEGSFGNRLLARSELEGVSAFAPLLGQSRTMPDEITLCRLMDVLVGEDPK
jgi:hypothetical protein